MNGQLVYRLSIRRQSPTSYCLLPYQRRGQLTRVSYREKTTLFHDKKTREHRPVYWTNFSVTFRETLVGGPLPRLGVTHLLGLGRELGWVQ